MTLVNFDPFGDELAPAPAAAAAATPVAPEGHDPFAAAAVAPQPVAPAAPPATPVLKQYQVVHHPINGYGMVIATGVVDERNCVVVGWFAAVSSPLPTDQLEPVSSS